MARRRALARVSGRSQQLPAGDALALAGALDEAAIVTLASAATVAIGAAQANTIQISGTTTITSFDAVASGAVRRLMFSDVLTLMHNVTKLILPGAANITTAAGDVATFVSLGGGNWRCVGYQLASSVGGGDGVGVLKKYFESAQQSIIYNGTSTIAHDLGTAPKVVSVYALCISSTLGYVTGMTVELSPASYSSSSSSGLGIQLASDSSNIYLVFPAGIYIVRRSSPGSSVFALDNNSWRLVIRAMA
ncbi:hypothetical protein [Pseudomonas oryzihabitans]|uniref:hypothetical protein n=1 Tax=Pseudomonas oryzihabitans TaxID=47885 RepID=UPI001D2538DE|nr:hypothetical protein [Pseudomonas oryzihabitans]HJE71275.1 hypothetical protein [Pseudomonas oryzihabitans]